MACPTKQAVDTVECAALAAVLDCDKVADAVDTVELAAVTAVLESDTVVGAAAAEDIGIAVGNPASLSRTRQGEGRGDLLAYAPCFPSSEAKSRIERDSPLLAVPLPPATPLGLLVGPVCLR